MTQNKLKKRLILLFSATFLLLVLLEGGLRFFGFGKPPLFLVSKKYEYILAPNQDLDRFGSRILVNEHSMRSAPVEKSDKVRVLFFGDSIINGGAHTDHDSLMTTLMDKALQEEWGKNQRALNVSCGSWGPENGYAYLKEKGDFDADLFVLVYSSHDYGDEMQFYDIVGNHRAYPDQNPKLATWELIDRYLVPKITGHQLRNPAAPAKIDENSTETPLNSGWSNFLVYSQSHQIPLLVVLHPTTKEVKNGEYNARGQAILAWCAQNNIPVIPELDHSPALSLFRDDIHYNEAGQRFLFEELKEPVFQQLQP